MAEQQNTYDDENDILANSTMIPNIVDDMGLSVYAVRLYLRIKRRVSQRRDGGTNGELYESTRSLAASLGMSAPTVTRAKRELVDAGLIRIKKVKREHGEFPCDHITIIDIWLVNKFYFSKEIIFSSEQGQNYQGKDVRKLFKEHPELKKKIPSLIKKTTCETTETGA